MYWAQKRIDENKRTRNPYLDLSFCDLREVPRELADCNWLKGIAFGLFNGHGGDEPTWKEPTYNRRGANKLKGYDLKQLLINLPNLEEVYCYDIGLQTIDFLSGKTQLRTVILDKNGISDLSALRNAKLLEKLSAEGTQVRDINWMAGLTNLRELDLRNNNITDLTPLSNLIHLEDLNLGNNQITNIYPLSGLTKLKSLSLWSNQITSITILYRLTQLKTLSVSNNKIKELELLFLADLKQLKELSLQNNQITKLDHELIHLFQNLEHLGISGNPIAYYSAEQLKQMEKRIATRTRRAKEGYNIGNTLIFLGMLAFGAIIGGVAFEGHILGIVLGGFCGPMMVMFLLAFLGQGPGRRRY
jgi:Leucine-rich repeat (LRR) protein